MTQDDYLSLLRKELVPALGCTEPIAIAYAAALCRRLLGAFPERITVSCSGNIIKNVKGVIVPATGDLRGVKVRVTERTSIPPKGCSTCLRSCNTNSGSKG